MKNHSKYRMWLMLLVIGALGITSFPSNADALTVSPVRFEVSGNPGDILDEEMLLINETEGVGNFYSSYSNFEAQGETGAPAFVEPTEGLGTWITTGVSSVSLAPGQQKIVPFRITIPKNAEPGGHFAVIFWGTSPNTPNSGVGVGSRTGVLVLLSVNGDVKEEAGLLNFNTINKKFWHNTLPVAMEYRIRNEGGDRIKPQGNVIIRNTIFLPTDRIDANRVEGNVLPNSTRKFNVTWLKYEQEKDYIAPTGFLKKFWSDAGYQWKNFAVGLYSAKLDIAYGLQEQFIKKVAYFFVFPWQLVIVLLVLFIIVFTGGKKVIKRYNRYIVEKARAGMQTPPESSHG